MSLLPPGLHAAALAVLVFAWLPALRAIATAPVPRPRQPYRELDAHLTAWARPGDLVVVRSIPSGVIGVARYLGTDIAMASWVGQLGTRPAPTDVERLLHGRRRVAVATIHNFDDSHSPLPWLQAHARLLGVESFPSSRAEVRYFGPATGETFGSGRAVSIPMGMTRAADYVDGMPQPATAHVVRIRPPTGWAPLDLREFVGAHELLYFLILRNLKLRYKQTVLGAAWAVLQPLLAMAVFTRRVRPARPARRPTGFPIPCSRWPPSCRGPTSPTRSPRPATAWWTSTQLLTKVYFPRLLLPLAAVLAGLVDLAIAFVVLLLVLAWYGIMPSPRLLAAAGLRAAGGTRRAGIGHLARRAQRALSRRALRRSRSWCKSGSSRRRWRTRALWCRSAGGPCTD